MGRKLMSQRRGKGKPRYVTPKHRFKSKTRYRTYDDDEKQSFLKGEVMEIIDCPGHYSLLMKVLYEDGSKAFIPAPEGIYVGAMIEEGLTAKPNVGNVLPLKNIPEGMLINNIEKKPGDGGMFVRSPGSYAIIRSKEEDKIVVELPSRRKLTLSGKCRAIVGVVSGGGRKEKPLLTAGASYHKHKAKHLKWPKVKGVSMNATDHPFGGKQHHAGRPKSVSRHAPPGRKVGHIASKRTGRKKRK